MISVSGVRNRVVIYYSIETYRVEKTRYLAVTSDEIKCKARVGEGILVEKMKRPLTIAHTREAAVNNLMEGIGSLTGIGVEEHVIINIRDYDEHACYYCKSFPKFEKYTAWMAHFMQTHTMKLTVEQMA